MTELAALKTPPHNIEAEEAVLGSMLIDDRAFDDASLYIKPLDFYFVKHQWIWEAAITLRAAREPIDLLTIQEQLFRQVIDNRNDKPTTKLDEVGGPAYLTRLITLTPTAFNAGAYARLVYEVAERRRLIQNASDIARMAYDLSTDLETVRTRAMNAIIDSYRIVNGAQPIAQDVSQLYDDILALSQDPKDLSGLDSGFPDYNNFSGGIHTGEEIVIAGEPGIGKSMFAAQIGVNLAVNGHAGALYSLEMKKKSVIRRWLSGMARVTTRKMRTGRVEEGDWPPITQAMVQLAELPIFISDSTHWTTASLRADLVRLKAEYQIKWFIVDYFDLLKDKGENEYTAQKEKSVALHDICRDLDLAGLVIHTLNKTGMRAGVNQLADVSGNRQVIYDADVVIYYTSHVPLKNEKERENYRTVRFGKFRDEAVGKKMFDLELLAGIPKLVSVYDGPEPLNNREEREVYRG